MSVLRGIAFGFAGQLRDYPGWQLLEMALPFTQQEASQERAAVALAVPPLPMLDAADAERIYSRRRPYLVFKRCFDFVFALLLIIILSPLIGLAALLIKLSDGGPAFFRQDRITGNGGKPRVFQILKFRTMVVNAEELGGKITAERDPRVTPVGHWLRRLKLDEVPQLFNILRGEMSFVGPRPQTLGYAAVFAAHYEQIHRVLTAGLTDLATLRYRDEGKELAQADDPEEFYIRKIMHEKIRYHYIYLERMGLAMDISILCQTIWAIFILKPIRGLYRIITKRRARTGN